MHTEMDQNSIRKYFQFNVVCNEKNRVVFLKCVRQIALQIFTVRRINREKKKANHKKTCLNSPTKWFSN